MKKRLTAIVIAFAVLFSFTAAFAAELKTESAGDTRAIVLCYENGSLVYSSLYKAEDGRFDISVPSQYDNTVKKVYFVSSARFVDWDDLTSATEPEATESPAAVEAPTVTAAPTEKPASTTAPASSTKKDMNGTPYEREVDGVYAPALVVDVETSVNSNDEDVYVLTVFYHGEEIKVSVEDDVTISTAPDEYSYMKGQDMLSLEKGDVICLTANIRGDRILSVDFITRPVKEDIVTSGSDYGDNFERLFASKGMVADKWSYMRYGQKPSSDKYQYAYGIVAKMNNGTLTLLNTEGITNDAIDIDVDARAYVYTCAVDGKEYETEISDRGDIFSTLPNKILNEDVADLNEDYAYNYALVRLVDDTATDIIVFTNYND